MYYHRATIQYDGTGYAGFQWQTDLKTIQNDLNVSVKLVISGKVSTTAASRTDTGVHAREQVVKITTESPIDCSSFVTAINQKLSSQIRCLKIEPCHGLFNPSTDTISKEYRYLFTNKIQVPEGEGRFVSNVPYLLDFGAMRECAALLLGKHDFCNFYSMGSNVKQTVREVSICELSEVNPHELFGREEIFQFPTELTNCYQLRIEANGFLKQMIRHIVRALWMVGSRRIMVEEFAALLDAPKVEKQLWKVAPPQGLILYRIQY